MLLGLILASGFGLVRAQQATDEEFFFMGQEMETSGKQFKDGKCLKHYKHKGFLISKNAWNPPTMII
jgi:hypothetical protein